MLYTRAARLFDELQVAHGDDRIGSRSTLITSQLPVKAWHTYLDDPTLADAILDRVVHSRMKTHKHPEKNQKNITYATDSSTLADVLERILDKGLVIADDIKIKLVDIELLTIQIRLLICSVNKAREMGIVWWTTNSYLSPVAGVNYPWPP